MLWLIVALPSGIKKGNGVDDHRNATLKVTTEPTSEPLTLAEFKDALRILSTDFDAELSRILTAARRKVEYDCRRAFITQTQKLYLDYWPAGDTIEIRVAPVSAVASFQYVDHDGSTQTVASSVYQTDLDHTPPRIVLKESQTWPTDIADETTQAITVTLTCGYGAAAAVPAEAKVAIIEAGKGMWKGCEDSMSWQSSYQRLIDCLCWTAYGKVI